MVWPFCPSCHTTLSIDASGTVSCSRCPYTTRFTTNSNAPPSTTTVSSDKPIPLWAKSDAEQTILRRHQANIEEPSRATVEEPCVKCNAKEVGFYTVQLRSVDEGQTVFYECFNVDCRHTWSINN